MEKKIIDKTVSMFLRAVVSRMKELGLNNTTLAARMKISRPYVVKVLRGDVNVTLGAAARFAKALEMDFLPVMKEKTEGKTRRKTEPAGGVPDKDGFIKSLTQNLFWDVDPATLDPDRHRRYIIQRVLERGSLSDIRGMFAFYTMPKVVSESRTFRDMSPKALSFLSCISNIPREEFQCYTRKQSSRAPWIY